MWWAGSGLTHVYIGSQQWATQEHGAAPHWRASPDWNTAVDHLCRAMTALNGRRRMAVWLSGDLCRPMMLPERADLASFSECQALANAVASARTGIAGPCQVWLDTSSHHSPAVAVSAALLAAVTQGLGKVARVESIRPWWAVALEHALKVKPKARAVGILEARSLTALGGDDGRFDWATSAAPLEGAADGRAAWNRTLIHHDVDKNGAICFGLLGPASSEPAARSMPPFGISDIAFQ